MLEIIEMHPDDKIVVKLPWKATPAVCDEIREVLKDFIDGNGKKYILVNHDVEMVILRKTSEETVEIQTKEIP